jgi:hypothetical protein
MSSTAINRTLYFGETWENPIEGLKSVPIASEKRNEWVNKIFGFIR